MNFGSAEFCVKLAETEAELRAAQALRYEVFVEELGGGGTEVDHHARLEKDQFDPFYDHLILNESGSGRTVGVYRLLRSDMLSPAGGYYSEGEYDLTILKQSGRKLLELGRSCLHRDFRGGLGMHALWDGLRRYILQHDIEILFGVASFHGTDIATLAAPLSMLHHRHLAPANLRVRAQDKSFQRMDLVDEAQLDRREAMVQMPSLIKAYLRLGGCVGEGAFIDEAFNTTDVCLIMDTKHMDPQMARFQNAGVRVV